MAEISMNMKVALALVIVASLIAAGYLASMATDPQIIEPEPEQTINPIAVVNTTMGEFRIELFEKEFKKDTEHDSVRLTDQFKRYAASGFYDGLIIHGVAPWPYNKTKTLINTGLYTSDLERKNPLFPNIKYGYRTDVLFGLKHTDMMVSWVNTWNISSYFYICNGDWSDPDNPQDSWMGPGLDPKDPVFGRVISGKDVIRNIGALPTHSVGGNPDLKYLPNETVMIRHIYVYYPELENHVSLEGLATFTPEAPLRRSNPLPSPSL